jgi:hypothetical protein
MFLLGLILVVVIRDFVKSVILVDVINYYFWYCLGLVSASYLFKIINKGNN